MVKTKGFATKKHDHMVCSQCQKQKAFWEISASLYDEDGNYIKGLAWLVCGHCVKRAYAKLKMYYPNSFTQIKKIDIVNVTKLIQNNTQASKEALDFYFENNK